MSENEKVAADIKLVGKETGPLSWKQLSDDERNAIHEIECRINEVQQQAAQLSEDDDKANVANDEDGHPLAKPEQLYERVLLIDGGRGTGKSSLLQTLIQRWTDPQKQQEDPRIPTFVKPFYLDFDPLPHKMPLMAGIVQAWKGLSKYYDKSSGQGENEDENPTLEDQWHALFHVAAVGWSDTSHEGGLIEQVLNREDQVQNWHHLKEAWKSFIDKLIKVGKSAKDPKYKITSTPVFVIAIDDVDLQVERMRELLPALRNLYHPNVIFIVAADKAHMLDMLQFSFSGQQRRLANVQLTDMPDAPNENIWLGRKDGWPEVLAQESIRKIFPPRNTWRLNKLSLRDTLSFPRNSQVTFKTYFESWPQQDRLKSGDFGSLAEYFENMTSEPNDLIQVPPIISYRAADQIFKRISHTSPKANNKNNALTAVRGILAQAGDELVKIANQSTTNGGASVDEGNKKSNSPRKVTDGTHENARNGSSFAANIIYHETGNLKAIFPEVFVYDTGNDSEMVLSGYPDFIYEHSPAKRSVGMDSAEFVTALLAGSLRDDGYGVLAPGLQWNIRTAIAWTSARVLELGLFLTLRWQLHIHPSPLRLYRWANDWSQFIGTLSTETTNLDSRIAYAWIYYHLIWLGTNVKKLKAKLPSPTEVNFDPEEYWADLLELEPTYGSSPEILRWKSRTLPLMARPELWLPPSLQKRLLNPLEVEIDKKWLRYQRERLITDGIVASSDLGIPAPKNLEEERLAQQAAKQFDERHRDTYDEKSAWEEYVGLPRRGK